MRRRIAILGSTGSIGTQTLDVIRRHPERFEVEMISARRNVDLLVRQALEFKAGNVVICDERQYSEACRRLAGSGCKVWYGTDSLCEIVRLPSVDIVVGAMVGFSGLRPTLAALEAGKTVALANKETLVAAGAVVTSVMKEHGARILPVDSEHSAIFQCLLGAGDNRVEKIHLTASGGPFRTWDRPRIAAATAETALRHPNWDMGAKVTIDSATMMNKGFEVIEAKWLFGIDVDSLAYPDRIEIGNRRLDFATLGKLSFEAPDFRRFPCLELAYEAIRRGGNAPCALNAANEVTVAAYLKGLIGFYDIARINERCLEGMNFVATPSIDDIFETNKEISLIADGYIN